MYKIIKNHKKKLIGFTLLLVVVLFRFFSNNNEEVNNNFNRIRNVSVLNNEDGLFEARINTSGSVASFQEAQIRAETSGNLNSVPVRIGDKVFTGSTLATFNNSDALNAVIQAEAGLRSAQAQLNQLKRSSEGGQNAENLINQQNTNVQNAYRTLLNTDLRAYPLRDAEETRATPPIITGTYTGIEEGEYIIETYPSGALSGASFRARGLEEVVQSINAFDNAVPLGTKGLQITFPRNTDESLSYQRWVIPVPNKRSSQYATALNNYETAVVSRELSLGQSITSSDQIEIAEAAVEQANVLLKSAQTQLARTVVKSPFQGEITNVNVRVGDFVNAGSPIATVVNNTELYIKAFVSNLESRKINIGDEVILNKNTLGKVTNIASGINPQNGKIEISIGITDDHSFISGEFIEVEILLNNENENNDFTLLPLQAVQPQLQNSVIYIIEDGVAKSFNVETGRIIGEYIEILSDIPEKMNIAASARGLRNGMTVNIE